VQLFDLLILGLTLVACISPLLTFAYLYQLKEWRVDRLREHLRRDGVLRQIFGIHRPLILLLAFAADVFLEGAWILFGLGGLIALAVTQVVLRRQPKPDFTQKAVVLLGTSMILTFLTLVLLFYYRGSDALLFFPVFPILQPLFLLLSSALWWPVDRILKQRVLKRARALRLAHPELTVIAVAGSAGKTTTKELIAHLLQDMNPDVTPVHVNAELGVARWIASNIARGSTGPFVVEMGDYRTGEIEALSRFVQPTIGVITLVGPEHLALFGSMRAVANAKRELLAALPSTGHAFLNGDNDACRELVDACKSPYTFVGTTEQSGIVATNLTSTEQGLSFSYKGEQFTAPLYGLHQITNILLAIGVAEKLGVSLPRIKELLASFTNLDRTFSVKQKGSVLMLDDTYNVTPMSMRAGIDWVRLQTRHPKVLFTTGLLEMGKEEDRLQKEMGHYAKDVFDRVIFLDEPGVASFEAGFGKQVEIFCSETAPVPENALLACIGRVPAWKVEQLMPPR
jgi:UDP-N-acetylmuramoyl-tripeptide--D-alanyl-D-alanine ligase